MTALSEALAAAQRSACTALAKGYVAATELPENAGDSIRSRLNDCGLTDKIEQDQWLAALDVLREAGASAPAPEPQSRRAATEEPATDAQWTLLRRVAAEQKVDVPDRPLSKAEASQVIDAMKAGTYRVEDWPPVPF